MPKRITEEQEAEYLRGINERKTAYQIAFGAGEASKAVLSDLSRFCRANEPCWSEDQRHHARLEGRREVWLRIRDQLDMTPEDLLVQLLGDVYIVTKKSEPEDEE